MEVSNEVVDRFMGKVKFFEKGQCWEWSGSKNKKGYGEFNCHGFKLAHRFSYYLSNKIDPKTLLVCHNCDNPSCVNPDHLWIGTAKQNSMDMILKNRNKNKNKTHCKNGHEYSGYNLILLKSGGRDCRMCGRRRQLDYYHKKKK